MIRKNTQWRRRNSAAPAGAFGSSGRQKSQVGSSQALTGRRPPDRSRPWRGAVTFVTGGAGFPNAGRNHFAFWCREEEDNSGCIFLSFFNGIWHTLPHRTKQRLQSPIAAAISFVWSESDGIRIRPMLLLTTIAEERRSVCSLHTTYAFLAYIVRVYDKVGGPSVRCTARRSNGRRQPPGMEDTPRLLPDEGRRSRGCSSPQAGRGAPSWTSVAASTKPVDKLC